MVDFGLANKQARAARELVPALERLTENTSASQIKTWERCKRLWWLQKVAGVREREKQHFVVGHALHSVAERYITAAASSWEGLFPPDWNKGLEDFESAWIRDVAARAVEKGVWQATPGSLIEYPIAFLIGDEHVDARGLPLLAKAETYLDDSHVRRVAKLTTLHDGKPLPAGWNRLPPYVGFIDHMILHEDPPLIADHKTSKNRGYATTPAKLAEDMQVLSYAAVPMVLRPEVDVVRLRHNIFLKNAGTSEPVYAVPATAEYKKVYQTWVRIRQHATEMKLMREIAPRVVDPHNKYKRADNWKRVKSAVEEGRAKEACSMYGGCYAKDMCFGRCTSEQLLQRMDSPDPLPLVRKTPEQKFGLKIPSTQSHHQEPSMPFAPKTAPAPAALSVYQDVYVIDPEDTALQYRARVTSIGHEEGQVMLVLYPNPDVLPDFDSLSNQYRIPIPKELALVLPHPTAKIKGYYDALKAAGIADGIDWKPAAQPVTPTVAATPKPVDKPARDTAFGLKGAPAVIKTAAVSAPAPAPTTPTPGWEKKVIEGTKLIVAPTEHKFWAKHAGKTAIVYAIAPGETEDSILFTVEIEGGPFPDVSSTRFLPIAESAAPTAPSVDLAAMSIPERAKALKGKLVAIRVTSTDSPFNCVLEEVNSDGISFLSGQMKASWEEIESLEGFTPKLIPGAPPTKEEKAAAKAAAKAAEKAATAPASVPEAATAPESAINPATALKAADEAVIAALSGSKITRKMLEGIQPLIKAALVHQANLESGAPAAVSAPKAPPLFTATEILDQMQTARVAFEKAHDMAVKALVF